MIVPVAVSSTSPRASLSPTAAPGSIAGGGLWAALTWLGARIAQGSDDRNGGGWTFTRVTEGPAVNDGLPGCAATWVDVDNDGDLDLHSEHQMTSRISSA